MNKKTGKILKYVLIIALVVTIIILLASYLSDMNKPDKINYNDLSNEIVSGKIAELYHVGTNNICRFKN